MADDLIFTFPLTADLATPEPTAASTTPAYRRCGCGAWVLDGEAPEGPISLEIGWQDASAPAGKTLIMSFMMIGSDAKGRPQLRRSAAYPVHRCGGEKEVVK